MTQPSLGERVRVPWGVDETEGEVVAVYGEGAAQRVVVRLDSKDEGEGAEPETVAVRASDIRAIDQLPGAPSSPSWVESVRYTRQLRKALETVLPRIATGTQITPAGDMPGIGHNDVGIDLTVSRAGRLVLVVEVKATTTVPLDAALDQLHAYLAHAPHGVAGLLVFPGSLKNAPTDKDDSRNPIAVVQWRDARDNQRLSRTLKSLLLPPMGGEAGKRSA
ncbi:hypothetical protein [Streptomyces sp. URMC 129]|uniref:hypothetical protein n=1 Tax=Streptomyces sp. URMC 129 TaxID=3423407 RepID=UPI003F1E1D3D